MSNSVDGRLVLNWKSVEDFK